MIAQSKEKRERETELKREADRQKYKRTKRNISKRPAWIEVMKKRQLDAVDMI